MLYPDELQALSQPLGPVLGTSLRRKFDIGRGRGIRTPDPLLPKQVRYQTALCPAPTFRGNPDERLAIIRSALHTVKRSRSPVGHFGLRPWGA
jgi:hypothetical protein